MDQLIIHGNDTGGVTICYPAPEALETYSAIEIGLKDTPTGQPFWVVNKDDISHDYTFFDAWELDLEALGEPTGYGVDYEDWVQEYRK
jgi:hypothetical protein